MDKEYHYYITYLIALFSGFSKDEAYKIAYSSQHVDDNINIYEINDSNNLKYQNFISSLGNVSLDEKIMKKILLSFHFAPGERFFKNRKDNKTHPLITLPNSKLAKKALYHAIKLADLYWIGIATHTYVDSWAHQNFIGAKSSFNAFNNIQGKLIPNIGHMDALDYPDLIGLIWRDIRLKGELIDNKKRFLDASIKLCEIYRNKLDNRTAKDFIYKLFELIKTNDSYILTKISCNDRISMYNGLAMRYSGCVIPDYNVNSWRSLAFKKRGKHFSWNDRNYKNFDWYAFQKNVKRHQDFMLSYLKYKHFDKVPLHIMNFYVYIPWCLAFYIL